MTDIHLLTETHERILQLAAEAEAQEELFKAAQKKLEDEKKRMISLLTDGGLSSFKGKHGQVVLVRQFQVKLPQDEEKMHAFWDYAKEHGHYEALRTVNYQRLNGWYKAELEAARQRGDIDWHPPGLEEPSFRETLQLRK